jgi:hypothetical protein
MAMIDLTQFSPDYFEAAKARWEALSEDHKTLAETGNYDYGVDHYGPETNEHFEIDFSINFQDSILSVFSFFSRDDDDDNPDAAYARLRLQLDLLPTNPQTVYKDFVAANTRAKWLIPVYGRVFRRSYREFISLFLPPEAH